MKMVLMFLFCIKPTNYDSYSSDLSRKDLFLYSGAQVGNLVSPSGVVWVPTPCPFMFQPYTYVPSLQDNILQPRSTL